MVSERVPRLIVGSSKEGLPIAQAFKDALAPHMDLQLWNDAFFDAGQYTLESLETKSRTFDGALIVGTADDKVTSRGVEVDGMRDNLLFEFGMFLATFGRRKAILALEGLGKTKVPSDLFGLTCLSFSVTDPVSDGIAEACTELRRVVAGFASETIEPKLVSRLEGALRVFLSDLQRALGSPHELGFHVWVVDPRFDPPQLVRVARCRTSPKAQIRKAFVVGEGITGECWRTGATVSVDFGEEPYRSVGESAWKEYGQGAKKGMSFELLEGGRERYRLIGATPIVSDLASGSEFLGCLSYNVGKHVVSLDNNSEPAEVERVLDRAAEVIRIILEAR